MSYQIHHQLLVKSLLVLDLSDGANLQSLPHNVITYMSQNKYLLNVNITQMDIKTKSSVTIIGHKYPVIMW